MRLRLGTVEHDLTTRALVMGVLGGVPAGGRSNATLDAVLARAGQMVGEGADLLELGSAGDVCEEEELDRLLPVLAALRSRFEAPLAVDTWRAAVLAAASEAEAVVAEDTSGLADAAYLRTAAQAGVTVVLTSSGLSATGGVVQEVQASFRQRVAQAETAGIPTERIVVDPGLDLGKSPAQSLALLRGSAALAEMGPALLVGSPSSRFIGMLLGLDVDERRVAGHAAAALGIARGARIVRTPDVRGARRVADLLDAVLTARLAEVEQAAATAGSRDA